MPVLLCPQQITCIGISLNGLYEEEEEGEVVHFCNGKIEIHDFKGSQASTAHPYDRMVRK